MDDKHIITLAYFVNRENFMFRNGIKSKGIDFHFNRREKIVSDLLFSKFKMRQTFEKQIFFIKY